MSVAEDMLLAEKLYEKFYQPDHPELGSGPLSVEPYISPEFFEKEREKIFKNSWMMICHGSEIPEPGNYVVRNLEIWNTSVIVARGKDGKVRVFHNVCPHRHNQLFYEPCEGKTSVFACKFHAWTFNLDGSCRAIHERDRFPGLDKDQVALKEVTSEVWRNFVFIHAQDKPAQSLRESLGTLREDLEPYPFEKCEMVARWSAVGKVNWKTLLGAFQEGYHFTTVHRTVAPTLFAGLKAPCLRVTSFRLHGNHHSFSAPKSPTFVPSPAEAIAFELASGLSQQTGASNAEEWGGLNPENIPHFGFDLNRIFPNNAIDVGQGWYYTFEFWPITVNETRFVVKFFAESPKTWGQRIGQEASLVQTREALHEDLSTVEATQRGMESGAFKKIILSDQELLLRHCYQTVQRIVSS